MLRLKIHSFLIIVILASVMTGAFSQNHVSENEMLSGLVKAVNEGDYNRRDTLSGVAGVLNDLSSLGALDFVADIYESNDFYASGYWGKDGNTYQSEIYNGDLPEYSSDDFVRPVSGGEFTSFFGYRESFNRMHKGVDISLKEGDPVLAALPGVVGRIGYEPGGYGHFVILVHSDGVETRYAHLSRVTAVLGQKVVAGQDIALGGNTGNSTGPHLHFEIRRHGKAINPLSLFEM